MKLVRIMSEISREKLSNNILTPEVVATMIRQRAETMLRQCKNLKIPPYPGAKLIVRASDQDLIIMQRHKTFTQHSFEQVWQKEADEFADYLERAWHDAHDATKAELAVTALPPLLENGQTQDH